MNLQNPHFPGANPVYVVLGDVAPVSYDTLQISKSKSGPTMQGVGTRLRRLVLLDCLLNGDACTIHPRHFLC